MCLIESLEVGSVRLQISKAVFGEVFNTSYKFSYLSLKNWEKNTSLPCLTFYHVSYFLFKIYFLKIHDSLHFEEFSDIYKKKKDLPPVTVFS